MEKAARREDGSLKSEAYNPGDVHNPKRKKEPEKEEADFTCLGHSTHIVFCPCSVVEYVWGIKDAQVLAALIGCDASCGHVLSSS